MGCKPSSTQNQTPASSELAGRGLTFLPRDDPNLTKRNSDIQEMRTKHYSWDYNLEHVPPYLPGVPTTEKSDATADHRKTMFGNLIDSQVTLRFNTAIEFFKGIFVDDKPLEPYSDVFAGSQLKIPTVSQRWREDSEFAAQRFVGCNPSLIRRVEATDTAHSAYKDKIFAKIPVKDADIAGVVPAGYTLDRLVNEKRLFVCDYAMIETVRAVCPADRFTTAPVVLFFADPSKGNQLMPLAIQLAQVHSDTTPIFTPKDPPGLWLVAKLHCQVADANLHEVEAHLYATHIVMEAVYVSMRRNLHISHPLFAFLQENFFYTIPINDAARKRLIAPEGPVPVLVSLGYPGTVGLLQETAKIWDWKRYNIPLSIQRRGLDDPAMTPGNYWRDDALRMWDVIRQFAEGIVECIYHNDADVVDDTELQAWIAELIAPLGKAANSGCGFRGLPVDPTTHKMTSVAQLKLFVTEIIYTVSAGHSAVNNGQYDYLAYVPNSPGTFKLAPPTTKSADVPLRDIARALSDAEKTILQISFVHLLSETTTDPLGSYSHPSWKRPDVASHLQKFHKNLAALSDAIRERNTKLAVPYTYMDPRQIAQGIAI